MTEIKRAAPPLRSGRQVKKYRALVDAAFAEPGEWFSGPSESTNGSNATTEVYRSIGPRVAEVAVRGDTVYLRLKIQDEVAS